MCASSRRIGRRCPANVRADPSASKPKPLTLTVGLWGLPRITL